MCGLLQRILCVWQNMFVFNQVFYNLLHLDGLTYLPWTIDDLDVWIIHWRCQGIEPFCPVFWNVKLTAFPARIIFIQYVQYFPGVIFGIDHYLYVGSIYVDILPLCW